MASAGMYLLEVSLVLGVIFLVYALIVRHSTLFSLNRVYLILGLLVSFIMPLINLPVSASGATATVALANWNPIQTEYIPFLSESREESALIDFTTLLFTVYLAIVILLTIRFFAGIIRTVALLRRSRRSDIDGVSVFIINEPHTFSFFTSIFTPAENVNALVIRHELVHVKQWHWADLILVEFASIILWFNPVMVFYKRALKLQHEFLADEGALVKSSAHVEEYLHCMVNVAHNSNSIPSTSPFGAHSIKTRIIMMTKSKTPLRYALLYLLVIPALSFLLFAFQDSSPKVAKSPEPVYLLSVQSIPTDAPVDTKKVQRVFQFGEKFNVVTNRMQHHSGIDFVMDEGENVLSAADGVVVETGSDEIKGNYLVIKHSNEFATQYFHMKSLRAKKGITVKKGEVIGFVGSTGLSVKNHLHYEVLKNGKAVDPKDYLPKNIDDGC